MLSWEQVLPFLDHPDAWIVRHAAEYLSDVRELPATVAQHVWRAIDRLGVEGHLRKVLRRVPPDDYWLQRILDALGSGGGDEERHAGLIEVLSDVEFKFLSDRADELLKHPSVEP